MDRKLFEDFYAGHAPWDIPGPQPAIVELNQAGQIRGSVLDVGCGTGENAMYLAAQGHGVWALDFVSVAIERARGKASHRKLPVHFMMGDALELEQLGRQFDTVIDCGLFHTFSDDDRPKFIRGLAAVLRPTGLLHVLCFSELEPGTDGPRRVTQQEIRAAFNKGWKVVEIRPHHFETVPMTQGPQFSPGGPKAWLATIERQ